MNLTAATPVQIDTEINRILGTAVNPALDALDSAFSYRTQARKYERTGWKFWMSELEIEEGIEKAKAQLAEARKLLVPFDAEYNRRPWTRAFLVTNSNGHVHKSTDCHTLHFGTRYIWLIELSGHSETEIVNLAGEKACTVCYSSAPVSVFSQKSQIELPEVKAARAQRAAEKAAREAKKAAKAISNPDGTPLRSESHYGVIETVVTAWSTLVGNIANHEAYGYALNSDDNERIAAALIAKLGINREELDKTVAVKVAAKKKRDLRN